MRLLLGLLLWVGSIGGRRKAAASGKLSREQDASIGILPAGSALARCGEYTRYQNAERRKAAAKAQQDAWLGKK